MIWKELIPKIEFLLRRHPPPKFVVSGMKADLYDKINPDWAPSS
jgi:hypothetical protein